MNRKLVTLASILAALLVGCSSGDHQNDQNVASGSDQSMQQSAAPAVTDQTPVVTTPSADANAQASMPAAPGTTDTTTTPVAPQAPADANAPSMQPAAPASMPATQDQSGMTPPAPATMQTAPVTTAPNGAAQ